MALSKRRFVLVASQHHWQDGVQMSVSLSKFEIHFKVTCMSPSNRITVNQVSLLSNFATAIVICGRAGLWVPMLIQLNALPSMQYAFSGIKLAIAGRFSGSRGRSRP